MSNALHETNRAVGLTDGYDSWAKDVTDYQASKTNQQYVPEPYLKVTNAHVKAQEVQYNPITQTFSDPSREQQVRQIEKQNMTDVLAQNKDKALRYEQTYNILNFDNKLKGLESRPDYPKEKPWYFRPGKDTIVNYNIISNINQSEHHFQPPEKRPEPTEQDRQRGKAIKQDPQRDYNLVTGRYLEHHDDKVQANEDILRVEAAKTFWKTREFDPIAVQYVDSDKEKTFLEKKAAAAKIHGKDQVKKLPATVQNEGMMYNPINMHIEDEGRLNEKDMREKSKKQRYEARHLNEVLVREETLAEQDRLDKMSLAKVSHMRVNEEITRGFDILTNGHLQGGLAKIDATNFMQKAPKAWDKITPGAQNQGPSTESRTPSNQLNVEFQATNFDRRSRRLNTNLARDPEVALQAAPQSQASSAAKPQAPMVPSSHRSGMPPPSVHSKISSHASAQPASLHDIQASMPPSTRSNKSHVTTSSQQRAIRTGGFQKLGAQIVN